MNPQRTDEDQTTKSTRSASSSKLATSELGIPLRRRVLRACDHCRRRKTKCDGESNCDKCISIGHVSCKASLDKQRLTIARFTCTYGQALKQSRGPKYVAHLEKRVEELENDAQARDSVSTSTSTDGRKITDWSAAVIPLTGTSANTTQLHSPASMVFPGWEYPQDIGYYDEYANASDFDLFDVSQPVNQTQATTGSSPWINGGYYNSTTGSLALVDVNDKLINSDEDRQYQT